jgi:hypothetical protein
VKKIQIMGGKPTRVCPKCKVKLSEDNMAKHVNDCTQLSIVPDEKGHYTANYLGPSSGVGEAAKSIVDALNSRVGYSSRT